jgi:kumamolisin
VQHASRNVAAAAAFGAIVFVASAGVFAAGETPGTTQPEVLIPLPGHVLSVLARTVPPLAEQASVETATKALAQPPMTLTVVLRRADPAGFAVFLRDLYDPNSASFHKFLTPAQVSERFGPSQQDYDAVLSYFQRQGLTRSEGSANRMTLTLNGTRNTVAAALAVNIKDYRLGEKTFYANDTDPSLPANIAGKVEAVVGLSNLATPQPSSQALKIAFCVIYARVAATEPLTDKSGKVWAPSSQELIDKLYKDCMIDRQADGYGGLTKADPPPPAWQGADGTGQHIGVVALDTFVLSDVSDFIAITGLPASTINNVSQVHVAGGASPGANQDEVLLDIDTILGTAPGAQIIVYDGPSGGPGASFQGIFNAMINGGVDIISNSWAYCEDQTTLADVQSIDTILQTAAVSGISAVSGSGDHGSTCLDGSANTVHVPADSPHITAVGGTTLTMGPGHTYQNETWWDASGSSPPGGQGGFGVSAFFARPPYQAGFGVSAMRSVPDVASNADPEKGGQICQASAGGCPSGLYYGGTSKSAPSWAAFVAMLNQAQGSRLGFLNALFYPLGNTDAFHGAASMGSDFAHVGLGSPNLARLHQRLTAQVPAAVDPAVSLVEAFTAGDGFSAPNVLGLPLPGVGDGATQSFLVVRLADSNGNIVSGKTVTLTANPSGSVVIAPASGISSDDNGAVIFTITDLVQETVTLTATDTSDNVVLNETPSIEFLVPPAVSAGINATPSSVPSDGVSTTTITITLQDSLGRPTPGKNISLSQGAGHSIVTGPSPPVTDASGQIQFTASDGVSETVVYTAVDVTDGNLPIPGSATVNFTGGSTSCVGAAPVAASGFSIAPWATGFFAQNFFFGDVNWGGCPGASNPTFTPSGVAFVADFRTGDLFQFGLNGGASAGKKLSNLNQTIGQPTLAKDGRLYASHGATTGNFTTGDIVEIDPTTGAQLRVVAANLTCPAGLSVDPLSGDLFFDGECFGAGSDNPSLWRIHDPAGAATLSVYAALPTTPNGQIAFSPDGTLYVVVGYNNVKEVVKVGGTNTASPPSMTVVPGISSNFCLTLGEAQASGAAKSLIVCDSNGVELIDITTSPPTPTVLIPTGSVGSGTIGADGCLYTSGSDTIYKLTKSDGSCGFVPTNPSPALVLTPASVSPNPAQGSSQTFTATYKNVSVAAGTPVVFKISGANVQVKLATTDASGVASISYVGVLTGTDTVTAFGGDPSALVSNPGTVTWGAGKDVTFLDLSTSPSGGVSGQSVTVSASLSDVSLTPRAPIANAAIHFVLGAQSCDAVTGANGVAACSITLSATGQLLLSASYAGSSLYTSASAAQGFGVVAPAGATPGAPTIVSATAGNGQITVAFTPPANTGGSPITSYTVACTPVQGGATITATGPNSPITVFGLTDGVTYACTVSATNGSGAGPVSAASNVILPANLSPAPIPALGPAAALALALLIALFAGLALRRRRGAAS